MELTNYHTHITMCDGKSEPAEFVERAQELGFVSFGFSSHAPLPAPADWTLQDEDILPYCNTISEIKEQYRGVIPIYLGMEIDYIPNRMGPASPKFEDLPLDYTIGSIHSFELPEGDRYAGIDGPREEFETVLQAVFDGSMKALVTSYLDRMREMVRLHTPDIIGHFDLYKMRNRGSLFFEETESWYQDTVLAALEEISRHGSILEVNTGGLARGKTDAFYPSEWILEESRRREIPVTISLDAHHVDHMDGYYSEAARTLERAGYTELSLLQHGRWISQPIEPIPG